MTAAQFPTQTNAELLQELISWRETVSLTVGPMDQGTDTQAVPQVGWLVWSWQSLSGEASSNWSAWRSLTWCLRGKPADSATTHTSRKGQKHTWMHDKHTIPWGSSPMFCFLGMQRTHSGEMNCVWDHFWCPYHLGSYSHSRIVLYLSHSFPLNLITPAAYATWVDTHTKQCMLHFWQSS